MVQAEDPVEGQDRPPDGGVVPDEDFERKCQTLLDLPEEYHVPAVVAEEGAAAAARGGSLAATRRVECVEVGWKGGGSGAGISAPKCQQDGVGVGGAVSRYVSRAAGAVAP